MWSSPYLLGICGYLTFLTMTATFLYFEQVRLVAEHFDTPEARTRLFSTLDFATNVLTWLTQLFITNRVVARYGLVASLLFLPVVSLIGFLGIALWPGLVVYVSFSVLRRVGEYALSKPAREVLFTVVSREEKYKAKNFIDTAISRAGDASTGWLVSGIKALGVTTAQISWVLVPLMFLWAWLGRWLAGQQSGRAGFRACSDQGGGWVHDVFLYSARSLSNVIVLPLGLKAIIESSIRPLRFQWARKVSPCQCSSVAVLTP